MSRKLTTEILKEEAKVYGYTLLDEFEQKVKLRIMCIRGHIQSHYPYYFKHAKCKECKKIELAVSIRDEIESKGYKLLNDYESIYTELEMVCPNGHSRTCQIDSFRRFECTHCFSDNKMSSLITRIENLGYVILSKPENTHGQLEAVCSNGHYRIAKIYNFINHKCPRCNTHRNYNYTYEEACEIFKERDFQLISKDYINCKSTVTYICTCGEIRETTLDNVVNSDKYCCEICKWEYISEKKRGENHHAWKGGASSVSTYVRNSISEWKKESAFANNYRCMISGENFDDIHHLYSFNYIFDELKHILPFDFKSEIIQYSKDELSTLRGLALDLHRKYGYGICLKSEIHNHFHLLYGLGNNDSIQFLSFIEDHYPDSYDRVEEFILGNCIY